MEKVLEIVVLGRAARNGSNMKNRQPLSTMFVQCDKQVEGYFIDIIREELNIKNVEFTDKVDDFVTYSFKPQLKTLGPKYGALLGNISKWAHSKMAVAFRTKILGQVTEEYEKQVKILGKTVADCTKEGQRYYHVTRQIDRVSRTASVSIKALKASITSLGKTFIILTAISLVLTGIGKAWEYVKSKMDDRSAKKIASGFHKISEEISCMGRSHTGKDEAYKYHTSQQCQFGCMIEFCNQGGAEK